MSRKKTIWLAVGGVFLVAVVIGLLLFQPWLLFIDAEHGTDGRAVIYLREDGSRYLRLEGFETSNGPDVHVWITDQRSGGDCEGCSDSWGIYDDGDYVKLGSLKGN